MPQPTSNPRTYRIKSTDNALTLPNRVTFPKGTYVSAPNLATSVQNPAAWTPMNIRTPYQMSTGTQASGLSGIQGASSSMYPTNQFGGVGNTPYGPARPQWKAPPSTYPFQAFEDNSVLSRQQQIINARQNQMTSGFGAQNQYGSYGQQQAANWQYMMQNQGTDDSWYRPMTATGPGNPAIDPNAPVLPPGATLGAGGRVYGVRDAQGNASPYGLNAFGERLDSSGNVWDPDTATTDIYGGNFIQQGEIRWERNKAGRLIKVKHLGGGKKRVVAGGSGQAKQARPQQQAQPVQQAVSQPSVANAFVSFRA